AERVYQLPKSTVNAAKMSMTTSTRPMNTATKPSSWSSRKRSWSARTGLRITVLLRFEAHDCAGSQVERRLEQAGHRHVIRLHVHAEVVGAGRLHVLPTGRTPVLVDRGPAVAGARRREVERVQVLELRARVHVAQTGRGHRRAVPARPLPLAVGGRRLVDDDVVHVLQAEVAEQRRRRLQQALGGRPVVAEPTSDPSTGASRGLHLELPVPGVAELDDAEGDDDEERAADGELHQRGAVLAAGAPALAQPVRE